MELEDHPDAPVQFTLCPRAWCPARIDREAVDADPASRNRIETRDRPKDRRLSGA
jgi:hypothetical protein